MLKVLKSRYELEEGSLAMYVYRSNHEEAAAFTLTHGGWTICANTSEGYHHIAGDEFWSRNDVIKWLEVRFPGLVRV